MISYRNVEQQVAYMRANPHKPPMVAEQEQLARTFDTLGEHELAEAQRVIAALLDPWSDPERYV